MLITVDERDPRPIYLQIVTQVKEQIRRGEVRPGEELPSVRELAEALDVNLHTVHHAYQKLRDQGVIHLRLGRRARVAKLRELPASRDEVETALVGRLREAITEAYHLGLSASDVRGLVEELLASEREGES
jgi:DNA-binding transcriptional regulator YhcF (GntR family)